MDRSVVCGPGGGTLSSSSIRHPAAHGDATLKADREFAFLWILCGRASG
jgi:hypothetical protein